MTRAEDLRPIGLTVAHVVRRLRPHMKLKLKASLKPPRRVQLKADK